MPSRISFCAALTTSALALALLAAMPAHAQEVMFRLDFNNGAYPLSSLVADAAGNLYGTTDSGGILCPQSWNDYGCGVVFEISPPTSKGGEWTQTVLHQFSGSPDGSNPLAGLVIDKAGNLYGTTYNGGNTGCNNEPNGCGTVFELSPPSSQGGPWTESIIYSFSNNGPDGTNPKGDLIFDAAGNLYGTTDGGANDFGTIFQLSPPTVADSAWTETVLYSFTGFSDGGWPLAGLVLGRNGKLYGTGTSGVGNVFELAPPTTQGGAWSLHNLWTFGLASGDGWYPMAPLVADKAGNLYGTTNGGGISGCDAWGYGNCGTVFELSPPTTKGGPWTETILYDFTGGSDGAIPFGGLVFDAAGNLYGTAQKGGDLTYRCDYAQGCGTVFKLAPPASQGGAWTFSTIHTFHGDRDGANPAATLLHDGNLIGTTEGGGTYSKCISQFVGCGTVFKVQP